MSRKPRDITVKVVKNKRCKGGFQIVESRKFDWDFLGGAAGTRAFMTTDDGEVVKVFIRTFRQDIRMNPLSRSCDDCVLGTKIAKADHCRYLGCWAGHWVEDLDSIMEDI